MEVKLCYPYSSATEKRMKMFYDSLNEKDKRHYAALEAEKLSYGGITYLSELVTIQHNPSRCHASKGWHPVFNLFLWPQLDN